MSGRNAGVQAILREQFMPKAVYVHCHVHRLNLVVADVCTSVSHVIEFYSVVAKIHNYFTASSVTNERFRDAQRKLKLGRSVSKTIRNSNFLLMILVETNLKLWSNIRWDSRWTSIDAVLSNFECIIVALAEIIEDGGERAIEAKGLAFVMKDPAFAVTLFILHKLLGPIRILSDKLKGNRWFSSVSRLRDFVFALR